MKLNEGYLKKIAQVDKDADRCENIKADELVSLFRGGSRKEHSNLFGHFLRDSEGQYSLIIHNIFL